MFTPIEGVDYAWVCAYASESWKEQVSIYQKLEDKAASVITWLGGGTGLFAVATIAAVSKGDITPLVSSLALLPFSVGVVAVFLALQSRMAKPISYWIPSIQNATDWASNGASGQATMLGEVNLAMRFLIARSSERATKINQSLWCSFAAVTLMALPLIASVCECKKQQTEPSFIAKMTNYPINAPCITTKKR